MERKWTMKVSALLLSAAMLAACSSNGAGGSGSEGTAAAAGKDDGGGQSAAAQAVVYNPDQAEIEYDEDDLRADWQASEATTIQLDGADVKVTGTGAEAKDGGVAITAAGTYIVSGKLDNGQITVNAADKGVVRLVLNGATIHSDTSSGIYVEEAGKTVITLTAGTENSVSDGAKYTYAEADQDEPDAAIFSHDDLTINGPGKLTVQGNYNDALKSKDKLKIAGGDIAIESVDDGLVGRDLIAVKDGSVTIDAKGDAVKSTNDKDAEKGYIVIDGGSFHINAGDDAIHSETAIAIKGGTIDIAGSYEGIEAPQIVVAGGDTSVVSSDDGINAAGGDAEGGGEGPPGMGGSTASSNLLTITGGTLAVDAKGDGLDANGSIKMSGGTVIVSGPTEDNNGALDYDGTFEMTGGLLVAAGSAGMAQATSDSSTQAGILMTFTSTQQAGQLVNLQDADGNSLLTFAPKKDYRALFFSSPDLKQKASYTLYSGGTSTGTATNGLYDGGQYAGGTMVVAFDTSSLVTWLNESGVTTARSGMGGPGGGMGGGGGRGGPGRGQSGGQGGWGGGAGGDGSQGGDPGGDGGGGDWTPPEGGQPPQGATAQQQ